MSSGKVREKIQLWMNAFTWMHAEVNQIHLQIDNISGLSYIVKMWGTCKKVFSDISKEIWDYLLLKEIIIIVEYLPEPQNLIHDL